MRGSFLMLNLVLLLAARPLLAEQSGQARATAAGASLIGTPAPRLILTTLDGRHIDLARYYGHKAVYLKFWATWCVPCLQQMPHFEHTFESAGPDLAVIAVNTNFNETPERVQAYRQKQGLQMPIVLDDGRLASALNLRVTPQHVLIARDGRIAYIGHLADAALDEALQAVQRPGSTAPRRQPAAAVHQAPQRVLTLDKVRFSLVDPQHARSTVLIFVSSWCESYLKESRPEYSAQCRAAREQTERLAAAGNVRWLAIASGLWADEADLRTYQNQNGMHVPLTLDASGELFRNYAVTAVPTAVVIGADGRERQRLSGDLTGLVSVLGAAAVPGG